MLDCPGRRGFLGRSVRCPTCPRRIECLRLWDLIRLGDERHVVSKYFASLRVKASSPQVPIATLSGGNQQKLILARWLARRTQVLLLDEPTRGVDVAAKAEIHRLIEELAAAGQAVLMISSELPEVLALSHRVLVMRQGRVGRHRAPSRSDAGTSDADHGRLRSCRYLAPGEYTGGMIFFRWHAHACRG